MSTEVKTAVGRFVWHDHISDDPTKARDFYTKLFGWDIEVFKPGEMDYPMIQVDGQGHGGFGTAAPMSIAYVGSDDVDGTADRAKELGGTVYAGPMDIPNGVGRFAVIGDPTGAAIGLFKPGTGA